MPVYVAGFQMPPTWQTAPEMPALVSNSDSETDPEMPALIGSNDTDSDSETDPEMPALVSGDSETEMPEVPTEVPSLITSDSEDELSIMDTSTDVGGDSIEEPSHYHSDTSEEGCGGHKASRHCMDLK